MTKFEPTPQQKRAIECDAERIVLSAGAGTGKTRVLTERFARLVIDDKVRLGEILAITFTEKAALELRQRIRDELLARNLRISLDRAWIGTIHGFCTRLLKEYFAVCGLDPAFRVLDEESEARLMMRRVASEMLDESFAGGDVSESGLSGLLFNYGEESFISSLLGVVRLARQTGSPREFLMDSIAELEEFSRNPARPPFHLKAFMGGVKESWDAFSKTLRKIAALPDELFSAKAQEVKAEVHAQMLSLIEQGSKAETAKLPGLAKRASALEKSLRRASKPRNAPMPEDLQRFSDLRDEAGNICNSFEALDDDSFDNERALALPLQLRMLKIADQFIERYREEMSASGALDFEELQIRTLELLNNHPEVREELNERFRHVMVDEFQDTNTLQDRLVALLTETGSQFIVGDVKQSIYAFRGAKPSIFVGRISEARREDNDIAGLELTGNFRSHPRVLSLVNRLFEPAFSACGMPYDKLERPAQAGDFPHSAAIEVTLFSTTDKGGLTPEKLTLEQGRALSELPLSERFVTGPLADGTRDRVEGLLIARKIEQLVQGGAALDDIAVLIRSRTPLTAYLQALEEAGIPYSTQSSAGLFDCLEVQDLINWLKVLNNPLEDFPLASVLASPLVGFTPAELFEITLTDRTPDTPFIMRLKGARETALAGKIDDFLKRLDELNEILIAEGAPGVLDALLNEAYYPEACLVQVGGERVRANLFRMRETAAAFSDEGRIGLTRFLHHLDRLIEHEAGEQEAAPDAVDAVRVMTIHKAKGLEFPVVLLPGLSRRLNMNEVHGENFLATLKQFEQAERLVIGPYLYDFKARQKSDSLARLAVAEELKKRQREEELRLLYVALTRAERELHLFGEVSQKKLDRLVATQAPEHVHDAMSPLDILVPLLVNACGPPQGDDWPTADGTRISYLPDLDPEDLQPTDSSDTVSRTHAATDASRLAERYAGLEVQKKRRERLAVSAHGLFLSPSSLIAGKLDEFEYEVDPPTHPLAEEESGRSVDALEAGSIVHRALEFVEFDGPPASEQLAWLVERGILLADEAPVAAPYMQKALDCRELIELMGASRIPNDKARELAFTLHLGENRLRGRIDLWGEDTEGVWVLDYKTGYPTDSEIGKLSNIYRAQLYAYAAALGEVLGREVRRGYLAFVGLPRLVEIELPPHTELRARLIEQIAQTSVRY